MQFNKVGNFYRLENNADLAPLIKVYAKLRKEHALRTLAVFSRKIDGAQLSRIDFVLGE